MTERSATCGGSEERAPQQLPEAERAHWMSVLARSPAASIAALWKALEGKPQYRRASGPEFGLVQVRARTGGDGRRFNLGEMTVTRCVVQVDGGATGHALVAGRSHEHAEIAAVLDGMLQDPRLRGGLLSAVVEPLEAELDETRRRSRSRTEATRVDFRTLVRGED